MSFSKLKEVIGDNSEAMKLIEGLEETQGSLTERVTFLEKESKTAFEKRDSIKSEFERTKELLGLSEINEETIKGLKKAGASDAEIDNLKAQLEAANGKYSELEKDFTGYKTSSSMDQAIMKAGVEAQAANGKTLEIIKGLLKDGATVLPDGSIGYLNTDGTTQYVDGKPMLLDDRVKQIASDEAYFGLFKPDGTSGGGSKPPINNGGGAQKFEGMSSTEMMKAGRVQQSS